MRTVHLARAIADPQEMRRTAIPVAAGGIDARQRLLIRQQQRLMADIEIGLPQIARGGAGHAAGGHEGQRFVNPVRQILVAFGQRGALDEAEIPAMHLMQVRIAAGRKGAQQVERAGRLEIGEFHPLRVGNARVRREFRPVDDVAAIAGQGDIAHGFVVG